MSHLLGIDLGTSSAKAVITTLHGEVLAAAGQEYPIHTPAPGYAEQNPADWWQAAVVAVRSALAAAGPVTIRAIGLAGQMHGGVLVDTAGRAVHPAIIWADQRTPAQVQQMIQHYGAAALVQRTGTLPATGFMGPTLLWLAQHRPDVLRDAHVFLLPKDYLRYRLTDSLGTEASDASATALFDVAQGTWADDLIEALALPRRLFPAVTTSGAVVGSLTRAAAADLGLPAGMPVVAGCADQAAQAVSNGLMQPGPGSVTLGTGGQVFVPLLHPHTSPDWHTFCHAEPERWYMLGAMLAAGLSLRWLRDTLGLKDAPDAYSTLARLAADVPPGADGLLFLPYLIGERSPLNDPLASGTFVGLALRHERGHLARAIMEGVALALRSIIEAMQARGAAVTQFLAAGNGLASPLWRQIVSDTVGLPLHLAAGREHTGRGAALLAGRGAGVIAAYPPAAVGQPLTMPDAARHDFYTGRYALFRETYTRLQPIMHRLNPGGGV